jgi:hypothetical protein
VRACNLLGQDEANAAAGRLGGIERDKKIFWVGDAQAAVFDDDLNPRICRSPTHSHRLAAVG